MSFLANFLPDEEIVPVHVRRGRERGQLSKVLLRSESAPGRNPLIWSYKPNSLPIIRKLFRQRGLFCLTGQERIRSCVGQMFPISAKGISAPDGQARVTSACA